MNASRLRIAVVTPIFPNSQDPVRGLFNYRRVRALQRWADVDVVCLMAAYPDWLPQARTRNYSRVDPSYAPEGVPTVYVHYPALPIVSRPFNSQVAAWRLRPHLERLGPDLVLAYWVYPEGRAAVLAARKLGIPAIVQGMGDDLRVIHDSITASFTRATLRQAAYVLAVSDELRQHALRLGADPQRLRTIRNGSDGSIFHPRDRGAARAELKIAPADELLLFVGRLDPAKGIAEFLQAVAQLAPARPHLRATLIGDGFHMPLFRQQARELGLSEKVAFVGRLAPPQVATWLSASNLLCLPSYSEGCPNVVVEAMFCGRPVVASAVGGVPELVDHDCAILVPPRDPSRLAEGLRNALERQWDEQLIAARCRRTWEDVGRETFEVCQQVMHSSRNGRGGGR